MRTRELYLLDTCVYGVLVDKKHKDYKAVQKILEYAREHRGRLMTTFIIYRELANMKREHQKIVLPEYYQTISEKCPLEVSLSNHYTNIRKLSWRYIQKLKIKNANKVFEDASNYALASYSGIGAFVTLNRKDILAKEIQPEIKRINEETKIKYVEIKTPTQFLEFLAPLI